MLLIFAVLLIGAAFAQGSSSTSSSNIFALYSFYNSTDGLNWNWKNASFGNKWVFSSSADPCNDDWQGVSCADCLVDVACNVTQINLINYNLSGTIPTSICMLSALLNITLDRNDLSSTLPGCIFEGTTSSMTRLKSLSVSDNLLSGELAFPSPTSVNVGLISLDLSNNRLNGSIPSVIGSLTDLTFLDLSSNSFIGEIPAAALTNCVKLQYLDLGSNNFTGVIPDSFWSAMQSLVVVNLAGANLTSPLADTICTTPVRKIYFNASGFTGTIPSCLFTMRTLNVMVLDHNDFVGTLPSIMGGPLVQLLLQYNQLSGTIPTTLTALPILKYLSMAYNSFTGTIPTAFGTLSSLEVIVMDENSLVGTIPPAMFALPYITLLSFAKNSLSGTLPSNIDYSSQLLGVFLTQNRLHGTVPSALVALSQLQQLNLQNNSFTGTVPSELAGTNMIFLDLGINSFYGAVNDIFTENAAAKFPVLQFVSLQSNAFSGTLPASLLALPSIAYISLSSNCLRSVFPEISGSQTLEHLYLDVLSSSKSCRKSMNVLFFNFMEFLGYKYSSFPFRLEAIGGGIPSNLVSANPQLRSFHYCGNGVTGPLPEVTNNVLTEMLVASNRLSGTIPQVIQQSPVMTILDLSSNRFDGTIATMNAVYNVPRYDNQPNSLNLYRNRLSDHVPRKYIYQENINILTGNSFECDFAKTNIPVNDEDYANFSCDSDDLNDTYFLMICVICLVLVVGGGVFWYYRYYNLSSKVSEKLTQLQGVVDDDFMDLSEDIEFVVFARNFVVRMNHFMWRIDTSLEKWRQSAIVENDMSDRHADQIAKAVTSAESDYACVGFFLSTIWELRVYVACITALSVCVYMPTYLILKSVGYRTHTDQYGWVISSLYLEGDVPTGILLGIWLAIVLVTLMIARFMRHNIDVALHGAGTNKNHDKTNEKFRMYPSTPSAYLFRLWQFCIGVAVMVVINYWYVSWLKDINTQTAAKYFLIMGFVAVEFIWHSVAVNMYVLNGHDLVLYRRLDYMCRRLYSMCFCMEPPKLGTWSYHERLMWVNSEAFTVLQVATLIFSDLLIPCIIVAVTNDQCFSYMFSEPETTTNSIFYNSCSPSAFALAQSRLATGSTFILDTICQSYGSKVFNAVEQTYELPFIYGKQCVSEILFAYIPVFTMGYFAVIVVQPLTILMQQYFTYRQTRAETIELLKERRTTAEDKECVSKQVPPVESLFSAFGKYVLPMWAMPMLWPIEYMMSKPEFQDQVDFSGARVLVFSMLRSIAILLTFGLAFSPLAVTILLATLVNTSQFQHIIQTHFDALYKMRRGVRRDTYLQLYRTKLSEDCKGMWKMFVKYIDVLLSVAGSFNALYLIDTYSGNKILPALACLIPLCYTLMKIVWRIVHPESYNNWSHYATKQVSHLFENMVELPEVTLTTCGNDSETQENSNTSEIEMKMSFNPIICAEDP